MTPPPDLQHLIDGVWLDAGTDDPIGQLTVAATTAADLEQTTDALLGHFVDRCRSAGRSWSEISVALGVTKQAVHKRFSAAMADQIIASVSAPTLERFTVKARAVVAAARRSATAAGRASVSSEDILLGLFAEPDAVAGQVLAALHVTEPALRARIAPAAPAAPAAAPAAPAAAPAAPAAEPAAPADEPAAPAAGPTARFTEDGKRALRDTLAVALELGHNYIGTEHLLLGLYRNPGSPAARTLLAAGASEADARAGVMRRLQGFGPAS